MGFEEVESLDHIRPELLVAGAVDIEAKPIQVVASVKVVNPMILRSLGIPPGPIGTLARATVLHGGPCDTTEFLIPGFRSGSCKQASAKHVGVMDRHLSVGQVADTGSAVRLFPRKI